MPFAADYFPAFAGAFGIRKRVAVGDVDCYLGGGPFTDRREHFGRVVDKLHIVSSKVGWEELLSIWGGMVA